MFFVPELWLIMAGPVCNILIPKCSTEKVESFCDSLKSEKCQLHKKNGNTWEFGMSLNEKTNIYPIDIYINGLEEYSFSELELIKENFQLEPFMCITICAGTNNLNSHKILAGTAIKCSSYLDGIIDFTGKLNYTSKHPSLFEIEGGDYGTPEFLANWLSNEQFNMVK